MKTAHWHFSRSHSPFYREDVVAICQHEPFPSGTGKWKPKLLILKPGDMWKEPSGFSSLFPVREVNWLPDLDMTQDHNSLLLSRALSVQWNHTLTHLSPVNQSFPIDESVWMFLHTVPFNFHCLLCKINKRLFVWCAHFMWRLWALQLILSLQSAFRFDNPCIEYLLIIKILLNDCWWFQVNEIMIAIRWSIPIIQFLFVHLFILH